MSPYAFGAVLFGWFARVGGRFAFALHGDPIAMIFEERCCVVVELCGPIMDRRDSLVD
jgi:hypothetical protein